MDIKKYRFMLFSRDAELMWGFAKNNQVAYHFVRKLSNDCADPVVAAETALYVYEGYMTDETYLAFKISVPTQCPSNQNTM
jgi:hypothetical protein